MKIQEILTTLEELLSYDKPLFIRGNPGDGKCTTLQLFANNAGMTYMEIYDNVTSEQIERLFNTERPEPTLINFEFNGSSPIEVFNKCIFNRPKNVKIVFTTSSSTINPLQHCNVYDKFPTITPTINFDLLSEIVAGVLEINSDTIKDENASIEITMKELTSIIEASMFNRKLLAEGKINLNLF
jgi:hypothetical protein